PRNSIGHRGAPRDPAHPIPKSARRKADTPVRPTLRNALHAQKGYRSMRNRMFAAALLALGIGAATAFASSHSEAPGTSKDRLADDTDLYAWVTSDASNAVTIVGNWVRSSNRTVAPTLPAS